MFVTTVINLLLFSFSAGTQVAISVTVFQEPLNPVIDSTLSEILTPKPELVSRGSWSMTLALTWAAYLPVSINFRRC